MSSEAGLNLINGEHARSDAANLHQKIARIVRNGQCPAVWCSVCGYACRGPQNTVECDEAECTNCCHPSCLQANSTFNCTETSQLRTVANINEPVMYMTTQLEPSSGSSGNLEDASKEELISIITTLRSELSSKNSLLSSFNAISHDLAAKRDAVLTVLELLDNIQAIKTGSDSLETRTIACSAKGEKIDEEWENKLSSETPGGREAKLWWREKTARTGASSTSSNYQQPQISNSQPAGDLSNQSVPSSQTELGTELTTRSSGRYQINNNNTNRSRNYKRNQNNRTAGRSYSTQHRSLDEWHAQGA